VTIQQHRRSAGNVLVLRDDDRVSGRLHHRCLKMGVLELVAEPLRASPDVDRVVRLRAYAGDSKKIFELVDRLIPTALERAEHIIDHV
jgi:hypothetical protein